MLSHVNVHPLHIWNYIPAVRVTDMLFASSVTILLKVILSDPTHCGSQLTDPIFFFGLVIRENSNFDQSLLSVC